MTELLRLAVTLLAAVNPAAIALSAGVRADRIRASLIAAGVAAAVLIIATLGAGALLNALSIEPETFRIAAGVVMLVSAGATVFRALTTSGRHGSADPAPAVLLGWPGIANPASVIVAVSLAADHNDGEVLLVAAIAVTAAGLAIAAQLARWRRVLAGVSGVTAALLVVLAAGLIVSGVRAV